MKMQGFGVMLKAMGIDPAQIEKQARELIGGAMQTVDARFLKLEQDIGEIKDILVRIDAHYVPTEMKAQVAQTDHPTLFLDQSFVNAGTAELKDALPTEAEIEAQATHLLETKTLTTV